MKLTGIISQRGYVHYPSYEIVYEWEDIIAKQCSLPIINENRNKFILYRRFENNGLTSLYHAFVAKRSLKLRFIMNAGVKKICVLDRNTIPVIIDFWLEEKDLSNFFDAYKLCPLVLITNAEVYELLKANGCPLNIEHWPLSFPDQYRLDANSAYDKIHEFCIFGRSNPFFIRLLDEYCANHTDFTYILNAGDIKHRQYINHRGEVVAEDTGRQSYLNMICHTKISCYTTPGLDEAKKETGKYNQVTPRLFEMLCKGCNVIGHYPDNADTKYYKLSDIIPNVTNYEEFEKVLDEMRVKPIDIKEIVKFMENHYTSKRIPLLLDILNKYHITLGL